MYITDNFVCPKENFIFFSLKLTCLIQTLVNADNAYFSLSRVTLPYTCIINPALRTLVCYWLIVYDNADLDSNNLTEMANDLLNVISVNRLILAYGLRS